MSKSTDLSNPRLDHIIHTLIEHRKLWLVPGITAMLLSWCYVWFIRSETYTARQTLIVRDDLLGQSLKPGQFESLDLMKSAQETILEIARKPQVIRNALKTVGPSNVGWFGIRSDWPDDKLIEDVQQSISLSAPNGAEFGHTETVVLSTKSNSRPRAAEFVHALLEEMNLKISEVRDLRLRSMKDELSIIRDSARASLSASAERLNAIEREIGPDLQTLRALSDPQSGDGTLAQTLVQVRSEKRQAETRLDSARNQRETLEAANEDPEAILATSDELFRFQPALNRLKQELIEAQSALAASVGRYEPAHPVVQKHQEQVRSMHRQIHAELDSARRGLDSQIGSLQRQVTKLAGLENDIQSKFNMLSTRRVDYLRLDEEVKQKSVTFNQAQSDLGAIERLDSSKLEVTLLTPVDEPQVSTRADGLGKTTTVLGSGMAGFLAGFGLVLLLAPGPNEDRAHGSITDTPPRPQPIPPVTPTKESPIEAPSRAGSGSRPSAPASPSLPSTSTPTPTAALAEASKVNPTPPAEPVAKPQTPATAEPQVLTAAKPTDSDAKATPVQNKRTPVEARTEAIQAEIDKAVAASKAEVELLSGAATAPVLPKTVVEIPTERATAEAEPKHPSAQPAGSHTAAEQLSSKPNTGRSQADSTGVPTAASVLASLDKTRSNVASDTGIVITPQEASSETPAAFATEPVETNSAAESTAHDPAAPESPESCELELHRRVSQRPLDIAQQAQNEASTSFVALEANEETKLPSPETSKPNGRASNPFLNPSQNNREEPSNVAKRVLAEAEAEANQNGMVSPIPPSQQTEEPDGANRLNSATMPIPDQIKMLTDSIASFAKPIARATPPTDAPN